MKENSEQERLLIVRGDAAILALDTIRKALRPTLEANQVTAQQLQGILARLPAQQQNGLFAAITNVATNTSETLTESVLLADRVLDELSAFMQVAGADALVADATGNVIEGLRESSEFYKSKTDDEIKQLMGL